MNPSVNMLSRPAVYPASFIEKVAKALPQASDLIEDLEAGAKFCVGYYLKEKSPALYHEWQTILGMKPETQPQTDTLQQAPKKIELVAPKKKNRFIRLTKNMHIYSRDGMFLKREKKGLRAKSVVNIVGEREWAYVDGKDYWALPFTLHGELRYFLEGELEYEEVMPKKS